MTNKTIYGAITAIGLKGANVTLTIKASREDIQIDELKAYIDRDMEIIIHDTQTELDEFADKEETGGKD